MRHNRSKRIRIREENFIWSLHLLIMIDTPFLKPSIYITTLHSTSLHLLTLHFFPFKLHPTTLHYPLIWIKPFQISCRSISPHITTLHLTSLHFTFRRFSPHVYSFHLTPFTTAFLTLFLKIIGSQGKVPDASAGSDSHYLRLSFEKSKPLETNIHHQYTQNGSIQVTARLSGVGLQPLACWDCGVSECNRKTSTMSSAWPTRGC